MLGISVPESSFSADMILDSSVMAKSFYPFFLTSFSQRYHNSMNGFWLSLTFLTLSIILMALEYDLVLLLDVTIHYMVGKFHWCFFRGVSNGVSSGNIFQFQHQTKLHTSTMSGLAV